MNEKKKLRDRTGARVREIERERMCGGSVLLPPHPKYTLTHTHSHTVKRGIITVRLPLFGNLTRFYAVSLAAQPAKRKLIEFTLLIESKNFNLFAFVGGTR